MAAARPRQPAVDVDFQDLARHATFGVWVGDAADRTLFTNEAMDAMFGQAPGAMLGRPLSDFVTPVGQHWRDELALGRSTSYMARIGDADGATFDARVVVLPLTGEQGLRGSVHCLVNTTDDAARELNLLLQRDALEQRVREKTERIELQARGMELTMEGMAVLRGDTYLWMNAAHAGMYGWSADDLTGLTWRELYTPEIVRWIESVVFPELGRDGRWQGEIVGRRKDGSAVEVELSLTLASDTLVCCCRDISVRKAHERRLEESMRTLDEMNVRLQNASRLKDEFLACMSHELRTPLHAMLGIAEILAEGLAGPTTAQQQQFLDRLLASGRHLQALISDLLEVSTIESGQLTLAREAVPLQYLIELAMEMVGRQAGDAGIALTCETPTALTMELDERRILQVLVNLLTNAVKFSKTGGCVRIGVEETDRAVVLSVTDTGIGIAAADQALLFQAFRQVDSSLTRKQGGTGLGLYLVKRLTELHGGSVEVDSEPGRGSCFRVVLPKTLVLTGQDSPSRIPS